jgi:hypothetical protein
MQAVTTGKAKLIRAGPGDVVRLGTAERERGARGAA